MVFALPDEVDPSDLTKIFLPALEVAGLRKEAISLCYHSEALLAQWVTKYENRLLETVTGDKNPASPSSCLLLVDVGFSQTTVTVAEIVAGSSADPAADVSPSTVDSAREAEGEQQAPAAAAQKSSIKGEDGASTSHPLAATVLFRKCLPHIGVHNFVQQLTSFGLAHAKNKYNEEVPTTSRKAFKLQQAMTKALKELSMLPSASVHLECWLQDDAEDFSLELRRADLEESLAAELAEIEAAVKQGVEAAQASAKLARNDPQDQVEKNPNNNFSVEIVGGGVRIPCVADRISRAVNAGSASEEDAQKTPPPVVTLGRGLDGSSAVATGACLFAAGKTFGLESVLGQQPAQELGVPAGFLEELVAVEERMEGVEAREVARLGAVNRLEAFLFEGKRVLGEAANRGLFEDAGGLDKAFDAAEQWFLDNVDDAAVERETYEKKYEELNLQFETQGERYFAEKKQKQELMEKELVELNKKREQEKADEGENKEDHDTRKLPNGERLRMAEKQRVEGNELFKAGTFQEAILRYQKAHANLAKLFDVKAGDEKTQKDKIALSCYLNTAMCYLKGVLLLSNSTCWLDLDFPLYFYKVKNSVTKQLNKLQADAAAGNKTVADQLYQKVVRQCDSALDIEPTNVKALFRKATALEKVGEIDGARKCTKFVLTPGNVPGEEGNADILKLDKKLERLQAIAKQKAAKMYGKMFG